MNSNEHSQSTPGYTRDEIVNKITNDIIKGRIKVSEQRISNYLEELPPLGLRNRRNPIQSNLRSHEIERQHKRLQRMAEKRTVEPESFSEKYDRAIDGIIEQYDREANDRYNQYGIFSEEVQELLAHDRLTSEEFAKVLEAGALPMRNYLKIFYKDGYTTIVNTSGLSMGDAVKLIHSFLSTTDTNADMWHSLHSLESETYEAVSQFVNLSYADIDRVESVDERIVVNHAHLTSANFIPLILNSQFSHMRNFWKEFQITESIITNNDEENIKIRKELCLFYALEHSYINHIDELEKSVSRKYGGRGPSPALFAKIAREEHGLEVSYDSYQIISTPEQLKTSVMRARNGKGDIHLQCIKFNGDEHYVTGKTYSILEYPEMKEIINNTRRVGAGFCIVEGIKKGILLPMTREERSLILDIQNTELIHEIKRKDIEYHTRMLNEKKDKENKSPNDKTEEKTIYFADTEAITNGKHHKAYCICYQRQRENSIIKGHFYGLDCIDKFIDMLKNDRTEKIVYFHNLKYDISFFLDKLYIYNRTVKGTKTYMISASFDPQTKSNIIHKNNKGYKRKPEDVTIFKDSYGIIPLPIKAFNSAFNLGDDGEKEIYPYNYVTEETIEEGVIEDCWLKEKPQWNDKQIKQFKDNLNKGNYITSEGRWNVKAYTIFYCERDVDILRKGFNIFREQVQKEFHIDVLKTLTISSLSHKYFNENVYSKDDLVEVHGPIADFIRESCYGGRCMSNKNELYDITGDIVDYDACSLYPSAMHRLYLPQGRLHIMTKPTSYYLEHLMDEDQIEPTEDKFISAFIVRINIKKINKHLDFPLTCKRGITNVYTDYEEINGVNEDHMAWTGVYTHIQLQDLIKYQGIEFDDIINEIDNCISTGVYWADKKSSRLSETIQYVYNKRVELKKKKDPTQTVYKLLMNSAYGKTIQKDILIKERYFDHEDEALAAFKQASTLAVSLQQMNDHCYILKEKKNIIEIAKDNWGLTYIGAFILAMSKRIMNEVFNAANEAGVKIFYQDTDSIHLFKNDLPKLEDTYKKLYGREIRGSDMGNFHVDFDPVNGDSNVCSKRCIILGKKCYLDVLENSKGDREYHVRMKGITKNALAGVSVDYGGFIQMYEYLYENPLHFLKFDMAKFGCCFVFDGVNPPQSLEEFSRSLHFEGKRNKL